MKNNDNSGPLVPKLNSTFDNTFEGMKIGMGFAHDLMSRYPAYKPIALANDAFFNISVSSIAQRKSFGQSVVEWGGGIAAGAVCTEFAGPIGVYYAELGVVIMQVNSTTLSRELMDIEMQAIIFPLLSILDVTPDQVLTKA